MSSSTPLLLHSISSTLLLALSLLPLLHSRSLFRAGRHLAFLPVSSTVCASLSGLTGLVALGSGSRGAAVVGGVCGALAVGLFDVHVLVLLWSRQSREKSRKRRPVKILLAAVLSVLLFAATVLHLALLCLDSPAHSLLLAVAVSRAVVHILFTLFAVALFGSVIVRSLAAEARGRIAEDGLKTPQKGEPYDVWRTTAGDPSLRGEAGRSRWTTILASSESRLIALQILAVLLDVLSVVFPLQRNYLPFDTDGRRSAPTLLGTTLSPAGHLVVALFVVVRWSCLIVETAGSVSPLSSTSKSSLAVHYHRTPTPSPSTAPLAGAESPLSSPTSTRRPSTSMSGMLNSSGMESPLASRAVSPWSTAGVQHDDLRERERRAGGRSPSASPHPHPQQHTTPSHSHSHSKKRDRHPSLVSFLSLGRSHSSAVNEATEHGGGVHVQTIELQHPYFHTHTETLPASYRDGEGPGEGEGEAEDLVIVSTPESPRAVSPCSRTSRRKSPPPVTPPPASPRLSSSSSAEASPVVLTKRSSSSLSFSPLLLRRQLDSAQGTASSVSAASPSPYPSESTPPSSPEKLRSNQKRASGASISEPSTPTGTLRSLPLNLPLNLERPYPHASSSSGATAYYSLPRSPPPLTLAPAVASPQSSPKKLRRPSLGRLPSFGAGTASSSGAATPALTAGGGGGDSPTRTRSGSVGSLLRALKRESTTPSLAGGASTTTRDGRGSLAWDVEPNEEEDDPFAPAPVGAEGKRQEERVREWEMGRERRRSEEVLGGVGVVGLGEVETVLERSEENTEEAEGDGDGETGSIVDHGEDAVERVLTPVPDPGVLAESFIDLSTDSSPRKAASSSSSAPATTRPRAPSESSSIFVEHFDDSFPSPLAPPSPPQLLHSASAGALGGAFRLAGDGVGGTRSGSAPALSHASSYAALPQTPDKTVSAAKASTSPYAAAGERFAQAFQRDEALPPAVSPIHARSPPLSPTSVPSTRPSSPFDTLKRVAASRRPSITPLTTSSSTPNATPGASTFARRTSSGGASSSPSLFSSASFTLRKMRLKAASVSAATPSADTPSRTSTASDLSFACRGPEWSPSQPSFPAGTMEPLARPATGTEEEKDGLEKVESIAAETQLSSASEQQQETEQAGTGRSTWWKKLPGSRPSTHYRRSDTPRISRSTSSGASFPSFLQVSTPSSSESSHDPPRRSASFRLTPLAAFQLEQPASVSPFGSFILPSSTRTSSDKPKGSTTPRESLEAAFSPSPPRPHLVSRALSSETIPEAEQVSAQLGMHKSAATSRRSFVTARTGGSGANGANGSGGTIEEEHLSELDDLVRTFSPGSLPQDPEWPSYPSPNGGEGVDGFGEEEPHSSFESPEGGFDPLRDDEAESSVDEALFTSVRQKHHSAPLPFPSSSPTSPTAETDISSASFSGSELSPTSPAFSFASMRGGVERDFGSPVTPASFSFAGWAEKAGEGEGDETVVPLGGR
ncbi:hypothetical protein JCM6882_001805 [Rhodosporidiobolus microsporus]